jgi:lysine 2,3-aminomutase
VTAENTRDSSESDDPLCEERDSPVEGIVHRYPDRVLFLVSKCCFTHCRYCTRSRIIDPAKSIPQERIEAGIDYIRSNSAVRDVLISGGDPLLLPDSKLEWILGELRAIPHVEIIRIGTKAPVVLPQRITYSLLKVIRKFHPVWTNIHFTHPDELTLEVAEACRRLADAGIPLGSQTVLLSGINDSVEVMKALVHGLVRLRVRPYYLYQCDPIMGSSHFRTPVSKGIEILEGLRGYTSGYAVPTYVIDSPGGGGKVPVTRDSVVAKDSSGIWLENYEKKIYFYPDPQKNGE